MKAVIKLKLENKADREKFEYCAKYSTVTKQIWVRKNSLVPANFLEASFNDGESVYTLSEPIRLNNANLEYILLFLVPYMEKETKEKVKQILKIELDWLFQY